MDFTKTFYDIINGMATFFTILSTSINDIVGTEVPLVGDLTLITFMLGAGITVFVAYTLLAWIIDILP